MQNHPALIGKQNWSIETLPWETFDAAKVDPELLKIAKAAAMVEYNAHDYAHYLQNVFEGDPEFQEAARVWAQEEVLHGLALGKWAERADPTFNFEESFKRFTDGFKINLEVKESIRGSQAGELIARCIVETGTSSYYTALGDACAEPVLKQICRNIAGDEHRHYKLFYSYLERYLEKHKLSKLERLKIGLGRIAESEDDELAYAYFSANYNSELAANDNAGQYDRASATAAYLSRAFSYYRPNHMEKVVAMVMKACGLNTQGLLAKTASRLAWYGVQSKLKAARKKTALA
jgi:rubrerythrin